MHERTSFFKYTGATAAQNIMRTQSLRWSSPLKFNDPFDVVREMAEEIKPSDIQKCLIEGMIELGDSQEQMSDVLGPRAGRLVAALGQTKDPVSRQRIIDCMRDTELVHHCEGLEELRTMWRDLLPDLRILCLCEDNDISPMWTHYADDYKGVVFEFACSDELDSAWLVAKRVNYHPGAPMLSEAKGWAKLLMMKRTAAVEYLLYESIYTKGNGWSYEKEWRVQTEKRRDESGQWSEWKFHRDDLISIYLGPLITTEDRGHIAAMRAELYPHANIFEGSTGRGRRITFK